MDLKRLEPHVYDYFAGGADEQLMRVGAGATVYITSTLSTRSL